MKTVAIIQARMGSTRLPGKVLKPLGGKSVLGHVITRVMACQRVDQTVIATTTHPADDVVAAEAVKWGATVFRGNESDVLERYYQAAQSVHADVVIRITSDSPLFDPVILCTMLEQLDALRRNGTTVDYFSNVLVRTFPLGLAAEIFTMRAFSRVFAEAVKDYEREHVTPYFYLHPELFSLHSYTSAVDLSHHRWTLDTTEDFELIQSVYAALHRDGEIFSTEQVLKFLAAHPEIEKINAHIQQVKLPTQTQNSA